MKQTRTLRLTQLALLVALELVMTYTPLGYLNVPGLSITFLMVPVALGAVLLGPTAGAVLGGVFGLTSFAQCFGASPFGAALLAINPLLTFLVCFVPRVLAGWLPALAFRTLYGKAEHAPSATADAPLSKHSMPLRKTVSFFAAPLLGSVLNTVLFMAGLVLCFYGTDYIRSLAQTMGAANPLTFVALFVGMQGVIEAVVCCVLSGVLGRVLYKVVARGAKGADTPQA